MTIVRKKYITNLILLGLLGLGCTGDPFLSVEPGQLSNKGFYFIDNGSEYTLRVTAMTAGEPSFPLPLLKNEVPPDNIVNIFIFEPTTEIGLTPEDIFGDLRVIAKVNGVDSLVYNTVLTLDWELRGFTEGPNYHLVFPR